MSTFFSGLLTGSIITLLGFCLKKRWEEKKEEKSVLNRITILYKNTLVEIDKAMKHPEEHLKKNKPNPYSSNGFLDNKCLSFSKDNNELKKEIFKLRLDNRKLVSDFEKLFNQVGKFNMRDLKTYDIFKVEIKDKVKEMYSIVKKMEDQL